LYRRGIDSILHRCLTQEEAELVLNDFHKGDYGGHLSGLATTQKILRASYFWPTIFKDCIEAVKKCHPCQVFTRKMRSHPAPLHSIITVSPFTKWGVDFVDFNPTSSRGHQHIIVVVDDFTKWVEAMPTVKSDGKTVAFFVFNQIIVRFGIPSEIVTDHGNHFQNEMMIELASKMGFKHDHLPPYYPQENGQVEVVNKSLKTIL
jgi:transposase InsO family protein